MSTGSDDIDEDELLQMALKEQAQRDLNYKKPSSNHRKPVVNYVQPPPQPKPSVAPAKKTSTEASSNTMRKGNRRVVEDDDDSEVEMLSISSEDEDSSKDQRLTSRARKGRDEERHWDGEEPDCWKRVDEAELARRVREMRETRAAPVAQKFERKPSAVTRQRLNNLQSFPRGMECIDPLGLGIIDSKALMLITETSDGALSKHDKDHPDGNLREKMNYFSEKFEAKLFLSRIHQDTKAADLEAGALALKNDLKGRTQQRKQLVKDNFDCFVSCKTTIDDIESKLRRIEEDPEGSGTSHLLSCIQGVRLVATRAFEPLFERQAQAEKIRSVQGMLQRFRTLFNLPSTIRGSIIKGEYDLAVREYKKAKSIALPSHVSILKRVLEEVEKVMNQFKGTLYKSLEDAQIDLTNLENIVRLLLELEPESDPIWHYLSIQNQRIRGLLERCTLDHEVRMAALHHEMHERVESDARWRQSSDVNYLEVESQPINLNGEGANSLKGRYIRRLTAVIVHHIPDFWKKSLSIFNGKFAKSCSQVSSDSNVRSPTNRTGDRTGEGRYSSHSLDEVSGMIRDTLSLYEVKVLDTFKDFEDSNILQSYMNEAMKEIAKARQAFDVKEAVPSVAVMAIRELQSEATKNYIGKLCSWMRASISETSKDETWIPVSLLERNKSPYMISYLPLVFRSAVSTAMDQINLLIQSLRSEATMSEDIFSQLQETQESIRLQFLNSFMDLAGHLEQISSDLAQNKMNKENLLLQNNYSYVTEDSLSSDLQSSLADPHQQQLMVLSNIGFCKDELSYDLYNKYKHIWLDSRERNEEDTDIQDLVKSFSGLEEKVLEQYTFAKANLIRKAAMNYLLDSSIHWGAAPVVKGVRDAAVGLLHTLVAVHAEVFAGARPLLGKTLGILVEGLIDTLLSIFHENQTKEFRSLDANGFSQLMLELKYFETILKPYFTPDAQESLKSLQGMLLEKATESVTEAVNNPGHHRRPTRGSEDADDRQEGMTASPDDLIELARQYASELLEAELERTRINTACFVDVPLVPEPTKAAYTHPRESTDSPSRKYRLAQAVGSPSFSRQRHR